MKTPAAVKRVGLLRRCPEPGCRGEPLTGGSCLAHAAEQDRVAELERFTKEGILRAPGVTISKELLARLFAAVPPGADGRRVLRGAWFDEATFEGDVDKSEVDKSKIYEVKRLHVLQPPVQQLPTEPVPAVGAQVAADVDESEVDESEVDFSNTIFTTEAHFRGAIFKGKALFSHATFEDNAHFSDAKFETHAVFFGATFKGQAHFGSTGFRGLAYFEKAAFEGLALFAWASFEFKRRLEGPAGGQTFGAVFDGATFKDQAVFQTATFNGGADFTRVTFEGVSEFAQATFKDWVSFEEAVFAQARQLGPMLVRKQLIFSQTVFNQRVEIEVGTPVICCQGTQFLAGVQFRLRWASVVLDDANLAQFSILAGVPSFIELDEHRFALAWMRLFPPPRSERARPRLLSVRRANLASLTVSNVDLRPCRFLDAHNLDKLRIEGEPLLARTGRRRTGRLVLAEEQHWRRQASRRRVWYPAICQQPDWKDLERSDPPAPTDIAGLYRDLRKGREDSKDEPGAADFYYGEMEMRRHAAPRWSVERLLLTLYWLVSGYALRAWRAFVTLLIAVIVAAWIFATVGFKPPDSPRFVPIKVSDTGTLIYQQLEVNRPSAWQQLPAAFGYSAEVATSLLRGPERPMTTVGHWTQAVLRWLGPLLFGLALLSLRGRLKR